MAAIWAMACLNWRRLFRDRLALAATFLLPVAVGVILMGTYGERSATPLGVTVAAGGAADGAVGEELVRRLDRSGVFDVRRYDDRRALERAVLRREVAAAVVLPAEVGGPVTDIELVGTPEAAAPGGIRAVVESAVAETAAALHVGRALSPGRPTGEALESGRAVLGDVTGATARGGAEDREGVSEAWALLGALVLFVFMNTMAASAMLPDLHRLGVLSRIRSTPTSSTPIAVGLGLGLSSYALFLALILLAVGWLFFGVAWASPALLAAVVLLVSLAAGALALVTGTFVSAAEHGPVVVAPIAFALGALAGCLWPLEIVGRPMQLAARLTPQNWAVEALRSAGVPGEDPAGVAVRVGALAAFTLVLYALGIRRTWRMAEQA